MIRTRIRLLFGYILNAPSFTWVALGFLISYLFFFIRPVFFSASTLQYFRYLPANNPIGEDLKATLGFSRSWFVSKLSPYIGNSYVNTPFNIYPPLANVLFIPLLFMKFDRVYKIFTLVSVLCYGLITFVFPLLTGKVVKISSSLILVFITGLFSYGFQFELERGQFNVLAVFLCFLAIWIYHFHHKYRVLAYILFTLSVQLKVYPFIFSLMLISDWRDWRNNLKRLSLLAVVNFALLFVLGPAVFGDFAREIIAESVNPYIWIGNHSIRAFVEYYSAIAPYHGWLWVTQVAGWAQIAFLAITFICIALVLIQTYRQKQKGFNPFVLLACTLGALLIPSVSHDYALSILAAPVAMVLSNTGPWKRADRSTWRILLIVLLLVFSAAYSSTLFSYTNKPLLLQNNFPALFSMLLVITILSWMSKPGLDAHMEVAGENPAGG